MNVLFLGNSYTYYNDLPELFRTLCAENGKNIQVFSVTAPGRRLEENLSQDQHALQLDTLLQERHYDLCILQEQSVLPMVYFDAYLNALTQLRKRMEHHVDQFLLYATWGRKEGEQFLQENHLNNPQMTAMLYSAFSSVSKLTGIPLSPVGLHFHDLYASDQGPDLYDPDKTHPSYAGSCLAALVHYKAVFGDLPAHTDCFSLSPENQQTLLESAAKDLTLENLNLN